jgi:hypothetical protein
MEKNMVKYKTSYENCMMVVDRSDGSKIILEIEKKVLSIGLENAKKAY